MLIRAHFCTKEKHYFEGWYIKLQSEEHTFVFIPGLSITDGVKEAFLQVIIDTTSYYIPFSPNEFRHSKDGTSVKIADNIFCKKGCRINLHTDDLSIKGIIRYGKQNPLFVSIMGPFELLPLMACKHEVISMDHALYGSLVCNQTEVSFQNGRGYMESDRGRSFPESYFWSQCNQFKKSFTSMMAAVAEVKVATKSFLGCIAVLTYKGKEYRLATYLGARIHLYTKNKIIISQRGMLLKITLLEGNPVKLAAPINGAMIRSIEEHVRCKVHYYFSVDGHVLLDEICENACLESSFHSKVYE